MLFLNYFKNFNFFSNFFETLNKIKTKDILLIIPNKYSFYAETKIYKNAFFKKTTKNIKVLTFKKLCFNIFKTKEQFPQNLAQNYEKIIILSMVFLKFEKIFSQNFKLLNSILNIFENFIKNETDLKNLEKKIKKVKNKSLKLKLNRLIFIFKSYEKILKKHYQNPFKIFKKCNKIAFLNNFFKNKAVFFMFFLNFNQQEKILIKTMLTQTDVFFYFCYEKKQTLFNPVKKTTTFLKLTAILEKTNYVENFLKEFKIKKPKELKAVEKNIFRENKKNVNKIKKSKNFKIFLNSSLKEQINLVALKIVELKKTGLKWHEIAVFSKNIKKYVPQIKISFKNFNIPYYYKQNFYAKNLTLVKIAILILEIVTNFNLNIFLNILKFNLTKFSLKEISCFENYIKKRNLNKQTIKQSFKKNLKYILNEPEKKEILAAQRVKNSLNLILKNFNEKNYFVKKIIINLINCFEILGIKKTIEIKIKNKKLKQKLTEEWNQLIEILETIFKITQNKKISMADFKFVFKSACKSKKIKKNPQILNEVFLADFNEICATSTKAVLIVEPNENCFPFKHKKANHFFLNKEIDLLKKHNFNFLKTLKEKNEKETFNFFRAICFAKTNILIFSLSEKLPQNFKKIAALFSENIVKKTKNNNSLNGLVTKKIAFKNLLLNYKENSNKTLALKKYFKIKDENLKNVSLNYKEFFKKNISPTEIEQFFVCPFSYFLKYILKINSEENLTINKKLMGKITHKILEKVVGLKNFLNFNEKEMEKEVEAALKNLKNYNIFQDNEQILEFNSKFLDFKTNLTKICWYIKNELNSSGFKPTFFELQINKNFKIKPVKIKTKDGFFVYLTGIIDRIDTKKLKDKTFLRIVDYKYKEKEFNYSEFLIGLNLQMLIYILTLTKNIKFLKNTKILGAFYMPTLGELKKYSSFKVKQNEQQPEEIIFKKLNSNALLINSLENKEILNSFKNKEYLKFSPLKIAKNNEFFKADALKSLVSKTELNILFKFVEQKINLFCECVKKINFKKSPINFNKTQKNYCSYCEFNEICPNENLKEVKIQPSLKKEDFFKLLNKKEENLNEWGKNYKNFKN